MRNLARKRAPEHPYLAVHWQMETINPKLLCDCAHTLVDVLIRMLHDESLSMNITTIWFASDYPYPIVIQDGSQHQPAVTAKSGAFKGCEIIHEAIDILRSAFDKEGDLNGWKLTDFIRTTKTEPKWRAICYKIWGLWVSWIKVSVPMQVVRQWVKSVRSKVYCPALP